MKILKKIKKTDLHSGIFNKLCVISAPSGAGKTSLIKKICSHNKYLSMRF